MEKILFVNACMRGLEVSRTHKLCRVFLKEYAAVQPLFELEVADLTKAPPLCLDKIAVMARDNLIDAGKEGHDMFRLSHQFAKADKIIVGAPYWDLSFPAALKTYVEHISVRNVTFENTDRGVVGLCRARKLIYITTAGGYIKNANFGAEYFRGLCEFFGIGQFETFYAEGLDIATNDPEVLMHMAEMEIREMAAGL